MKKFLLIAAVVAVFYVWYGKTNEVSPTHKITSNPYEQSSSSNGVPHKVTSNPYEQSNFSNAIQSAFNEQRSGVQVQGEGVVSKLLADDNDGSRHQRFILTLPSGQTLLVAHNIDLAPRIASLKSGDSVAFSGVYEWNAKGGVIHWTHHDPAGHHQAGWLKHAGQIYQ